MKLTLPILFTFLLSCVVQAQVLPTASSVDINRYIGKWYAVKSLPQSFTKNCVGQTADYAVINETSISVLNTCLKAKGQTSITGTATVKNRKTNAELKVRFNTWWNRLFPFIQGEYTIIKLDPNYEYVMVGSSDRKSLWYLSRRPELSQDVIDEYDAFADKLGFPVEKMILSEF